MKVIDIIYTIGAFLLSGIALITDGPEECAGLLIFFLIVAAVTAFFRYERP